MEETSLDQFLDTSEDSDDASGESGESVDASKGEHVSEKSELSKNEHVSGDGTENDGVGNREEPPSGEVHELASGDVDPATTTSRWRARGNTCSDCGSEPNRLWFEGANAVCRTCKEW